MGQCSGSMREKRILKHIDNSRKIILQLQYAEPL